MEQQIPADDAQRRNPPEYHAVPEVKLRNPGNQRSSKKIRQSLRKSNTVEEVCSVDVKFVDGN